MPDRPISPIVRKFRESVGRAALGDDLEVVCHIFGGMPSQRYEHEIRVAGSGAARVALHDARRVIHTEATGTLGGDEVRELLRKIGEDVETLVPPSDAQFPPDSLVGSVTLRVAGQEKTFFFDPDERRQLKSGTFASAPIAQAIRTFGDISERLIGLSQRPGGHNGEPQR
jgi:hypothetical protein